MRGYLAPISQIVISIYNVRTGGILMPTQELPADISSNAVTEKPILTASSSPTGIAAGPDGDGNLWFTERAGNKIGRLNPTTGVINVPNLTTTSNHTTVIAAVPNHKLWITDTAGNR